MFAMRKWIACLLAALLLLGLLPAGAESVSAGSGLTPVEQLVDADGNVIFTDALVEQAVRDCSGIYDGPISAKKIASMGSSYISLRLYSADPVTVDLSVLQLCKRLKMLELDGVTPADWSAVAALPAMTYFSAYGLELDNLDFLGGSKKLLDLVLDHTTCADISAVAGIASLIDFRCNTAIADLSPLYGLKKLNHIEVGGLTEEQLAALLDARGKKLVELGLTDCDLSDAMVERIAGMKLVSLMLDNVRLRAITFLLEIPTLKSGLTLANMEILSLEGIQNLKKLNTVMLRGITGLTSLTPIFQMPGLTSLWLEDCAAPDLTGAEGMKKLTELWLQNVSGTVDLTPVYALAKLKTLGLFSVTLQTFEGVEGLAGLKTLYLFDVQGVSDYAPLAGLKRIQYVATDRPELLPAGLPTY